MGLPAGAAGASQVVSTPHDGNGNVLGGSSAHPVYVSNGQGPAIARASAAGTAVTAASETSLLPAAAKAIIKANFFQVGTVLRVKAAGIISSVITTPGTARFKVKLGPTSNIVVFDGLAILLDSTQAHTNDAWLLEILLTCRAVGSGTSANLWGTGVFQSNDVAGVGTMPLAGMPAMLPWAQSSQSVGTGFDSTVDNVLDLTFTQTVATGSITLEQYTVEQVA